MVNCQKAKNCLIGSRECWGIMIGIVAVLMGVAGWGFINYNTPSPKSGTQCLILAQNISCSAHENQQTCFPKWEVKYLNWWYKEGEWYQIDTIDKTPKFNSPGKAWQEARQYQINETYPCYYRTVSYYYWFNYDHPSTGLYFQEHLTGHLILGSLLLILAILLCLTYCFLSCCFTVEWIEEEDLGDDIELEEQSEGSSSSELEFSTASVS